MSYFTKFPKIDYDVTGNKNTKSIRDFLIRVKIKKAVQNKILYSPSMMSKKVNCLNM